MPTWSCSDSWSESLLFSSPPSKAASLIISIIFVCFLPSNENKLEEKDNVKPRLHKNVKWTFKKLTCISSNKSLLRCSEESISRINFAKHIIHIVCFPDPNGKKQQKQRQSHNVTQHRAILPIITFHIMVKIPQCIEELLLYQI